jgi:predicted phage gp36 major capsid-like protein
MGSPGGETVSELKDMIKRQSHPWWKLTLQEAFDLHIKLESRIRELEADEEFHICKNNEYMERIENLEAENEQRKQDFEGTCQELNQVKAERDRLRGTI